MTWTEEHSGQCQGPHCGHNCQHSKIPDTNLEAQLDRSMERDIFKTLHSATWPNYLFLVQDIQLATNLLGTVETPGLESSV